MMLIMVFVTPFTGVWIEIGTDANNHPLSNSHTYASASSLAVPLRTGLHDTLCRYSPAPPRIARGLATPPAALPVKQRLYMSNPAPIRRNFDPHRSPQTADLGASHTKHRPENYPRSYRRYGLAILAYFWNRGDICRLIRKLKSAPGNLR